MEPLSTTFKSFTLEKQQSLLASGYVRSLESAWRVLFIPTEISKLIVQFLCLNTFKFSKPNTECFKIGDDQLSIQSIKDTFGTIQFGEFLGSADKIIYSVTFAMDEMTPGTIGVGFILPPYKSWSREDYNRCEAHSTYIYGNGTYYASPEFEAVNPKYEHVVANRSDSHWIECGDRVTVQVNMFEHKAKAVSMKRRQTAKGGNKQNNNDNEDDDEFVQHAFMFAINLPDEDVAVMLDVGPNEHSVRVIEQSFSLSRSVKLTTNVFLPS